MSVLRDIGTYLQTLGYGSLYANPKTIQIDAMDNEPHNVISVMGIGGPQSIKSMGEVTAFEQCAFQVMVRNVNPEVAEATAYAIWKTLGCLLRVTINGHDYNKITETLYPSKLSVDENARTTYYCEFLAWRRPE